MHFSPSIIPFPLSSMQSSNSSSLSPSLTPAMVSYIIIVGDAITRIISGICEPSATYQPTSVMVALHTVYRVHVMDLYGLSLECMCGRHCMYIYSKSYGLTAHAVCVRSLYARKLLWTYTQSAYSLLKALCSHRASYRLHVSPVCIYRPTCSICSSKSDLRTGQFRDASSSTSHSSLCLWQYPT